jgi:hypothetical protein
MWDETMADEVFKILDNTRAHEYRYREKEDTPKLLRDALLGGLS